MRKTSLAIMLTAILAASLTIAFQVQPAKAATIIVPDDYPTIQEAINAANPGDTVFVRSGTYGGTVTIDKTVSLIGEDPRTTIIDGDAGPHGFSMIILEDDAQNALIQGFTIKNGQRGITRHSLWNGDNPPTPPALLGVSIIGNTIQNMAKNGIALHVANHFEVLRNTVSNCGECAYEINECYECLFYHNTFNNDPEVGNAGDFGGDNYWDNGYPGGGNYWNEHNNVDNYHGPDQSQPGGDGIADTEFRVPKGDEVYDNYPLSMPWQVPDIAVVAVAPFKTVVGVGYSMNVTITFENQGRKVEGFDIEVRANGLTVSSESVIGRPKSKAGTLENIQVWDTTDKPKGNYEISSYIEPLDCEEDTSDNSATDGVVLVTIPGDVDGDRDVDIFDIVRIIAAYGSSVGEPEYDPNCDIDNDGDVDQADLDIALSHYGESW